MPSWSEIQEYARSQYMMTRDEENWFSITFGYEDGRSQLIRVRTFNAYDEEWIEFISVICKGNEMSPIVALKKNAKLPIGAIALDDDGDYVLIHNAPLSTMDIEEFVRPLHAIARIADSIEEEHSGGDEW
jgi:regulation of enolase protein 1 (concanavalin A-like superfamily)